MAPRRRESQKKSTGPTEPICIAGNLFFLDLGGFRGIRNLRSKLTALGGYVEPILNKNVDCVITNRADKIRALKKRSSRGSSSFLAPQKSRQARGRPIVTKSKDASNMDILERASALGIQITHVKVVLQWIDDLTTQHPAIRILSTRTRSPVATRTTTARQLRAQSVSRCCKSMATCPKLEFGARPCDMVQPMQTRATGHRKTTKTISTKRLTSVKKRSPKTRARLPVTPDMCRTPETSASPVDWAPSPTPAKEKRVQKNELRKRLKQIQRRLSFSGFDDEPIRSKIISTPRKRRQLKVYSPISSPISSSVLTTPKKRKLESRGSYTEIAPSTMKKRVRNRNQKKPVKDNKRRRQSSHVIKDLMTRLDDAKASRQDVSSVQRHTKIPKIKRTRPVPRRTCVITYQKRHAGTRNSEPTVQQVARQLKRELAATTPVICTMDLRNGKTKISQL